MGASLAAGAQALPKDSGGVFVFLGDMPLIPHEVPMALAEALAGGGTAAAPAYKGRRGHPVLFGASLIPALAQLGGDEGARLILRNLGVRLALVETDDPGVLMDIDTQGDLPAA
jgi:molybdenum cofactor cytidylyltransferase